VITRVNAIYLVSCPGATAIDAENGSSSDLPTLPLDSLEELEAFEKFVGAEEHGISAVSSVCGIQE